jgi:hypothetical protein
MDQSVDATVASLGLKIANFFGYLFRIVLAMRPQREREAAKIAEEFHCRRTIDHRDCRSSRRETHREGGAPTAT